MQPAFRHRTPNPLNEAYSAAQASFGSSFLQASIRPRTESTDLSNIACSSR